ncbi:MAG: FKBP-type peptidyl-prolyl cis-trans isomerase [Planctomycetaceae bacterium]
MTDSGLRYRVLRKGQGRHPQPTDTITVNYAGWLDDGTQFDSSYKSPQPFVTPLTRVVRGWTEGLQLIGAGGMIELEISSGLGYGARGRGRAIPPDATLHFLVELLKVAAPNEPAAAGPRDPDAPLEFTTTPSGLKYRIVRKGDGKHPSIIDTVTLHYQGWLDDGTVFDSSYDRGAAATLSLGEVIPGWTEALPHLGAGGMMEMEVPSELGYGAEGAGSEVPPNATLHFLVELLAVD